MQTNTFNQGSQPRRYSNREIRIISHDPVVRTTILNEKDQELYGKGELIIVRLTTRSGFNMLLVWIKVLVCL